MEGKLVNLLSKTRSFKNCKLLFRASQDGFNASQFHSKCDNKGPTVTIIKTFNNCIFGGYTPLSWNTSDSFQRDNSSFLFSFIGKNEEERNVRIENQGQKDNTKSIYCALNNGPTFGGYDLYVSNDFKSNSNYSNLGHSYSVSGVSYGTSQAKEYLAGSYKFSITELEVYELK
ncbi:hypothetical protein FDP41_008396 [Naegleria fowleri]|uniref:TLDc domain-containing protein n=1 Tax=Naegleria fowleri TaxID=5763 RepID=A0A6A5BJE5_NAEFO|nr:uncharacterized protein FDP41_008396 [Naegleria fowleri]KAF0973189.1 hypothetical protein FDP41_008396 [Naegleria fowleri]